MYVGILGEGRYEITGSPECTVDQLAAELEMVADTGDPEVFAPVLATLLGLARKVGHRVQDEGPVDLLLPDEAAQLAEVRRALYVA